MSDSLVRDEGAGVEGGDPQVSERGRKVRWLLLVSFGWLLALLIGAGLDAFVSLRRLDAVSQEVSQRFSARNQAVVTIIPQGLKPDFCWLVCRS